MAALVDSNTTAPRQLQALQDAARARGVELSIYRVAKPDEIAPAIDAAKASDTAALNVLASPLLVGNRLPKSGEGLAAVRCQSLFDNGGTGAAVSRAKSSRMA